jgi:hypothetical protein
MRTGYKDPAKVRSVRRMTRLTEKEDAKVERLAARKGMTASSFLQQLIQKAK